MDDMNLLGQSLTRQQQLMDEADAWRLGQTTNPLAKTEIKDPIYAPTLAKVGEMMVKLGAQLEAKYSGVMQPDEYPTSSTPIKPAFVKPIRS